MESITPTKVIQSRIRPSCANYDPSPTPTPQDLAKAAGLHRCANYIPGTPTSATEETLVEEPTEQTMDPSTPEESAETGASASGPPPAWVTRGLRSRSPHR